MFIVLQRTSIACLLLSALWADPVLAQPPQYRPTPRRPASNIQFARWADSAAGADSQLPAARQPASRLRRSVPATPAPGNGSTLENLPPGDAIVEEFQPGDFQSGGDEVVMFSEEPVMQADACGSCGECATGCAVGPGRCLWIRGEYLLWWTKGMETPPLVTTGSEGTLDADDTVILFGGDDLLDETRHGFRIRAGTWLDCNRRIGLEGEYWRLSEESEHFEATSDAEGVPNRFRPFFNINPRDADDALAPPAREDVELISFSDVLAGSVFVDARSEVEGAGAWLRYNLCCDDWMLASCDPCNACGLPAGRRFDLLVGYRYMRLTDRLTIREDLTSLEAEPNQGSFDLTDSFDTANDFHGVDLGVAAELNRGPWSLELMGRMALGTVDQVVTIAGETIISGSESSDGTYTGGLLAQRTNIGTHSRSEFAVLPQLGATLGFQLAPGLRATAGYNFVYLSRVVRAGEQIDLDLNPDLLPPEFEPFAGPERPRFEFRDTDFWAQGFSFGVQMDW